MISRRGLLFGTLAVVGAAALRLGLSQPEDAVRIVLLKRLSYLKLDPAGLSSFAADFVGGGKMASGKLRLIAAMAPLYHWLPANEETPDSIRHGEERIVTAYLLSSDFFIGGANEEQVVHYSGLFDPWKKPEVCRNAFARLSA